MLRWLGLRCLAVCLLYPAATGVLSAQEPPAEKPPTQEPPAQQQPPEKPPTQEPPAQEPGKITVSPGPATNNVPTIQPESTEKITVPPIPPDAETNNAPSAIQPEPSESVLVSPIVGTNNTAPTIQQAFPAHAEAPAGASKLHRLWNWLTYRRRPTPRECQTCTGEASRRCYAPAISFMENRYPTPQAVRE